MSLKQQLKDSIALERRRTAEENVKRKFGITADTFEHLVKLEIDLLKSEGYNEKI